ncbi:hypothetical protein TPA0905_24220 [Streptomyces olivaceus]|nr:hypothetical protein TPA0905_24220 [Streptomyces olivaceus]
MLSATECAASDSRAGEPAKKPPTALATAMTRLAARATSTVTRVLRSALLSPSRPGFCSEADSLTKARLPPAAPLTPAVRVARQCRRPKTGNASSMADERREADP